MKVFVIGATGLIGSAVVKELAARGHQVVATSRGALAQPIAGVTYVQADVNAPDFAAQLEGYDAVVSAFNPGWQNTNYVADFKRGADSIIAAAKQANVPYLLVVGGAGSLYVTPGVQLVDTPDFPAAIYPTANVAREMLNDLKPRRDVNWAFFSPAAMFMVNPVSYERTGRYRLGQDDVLFAADGQPADISVPDLAVAVADDVERKGHLFARFTVAAV